MWRFTNRIINKFMKNTHNVEPPEWIWDRVQEQSELIRQWYSKEPIDPVKDWEITQQWNDSADPAKDWKWRPYGSKKFSSDR